MFAPGFRALVIGASGGIGAAFVAQLGADPRCAGVEALHRRSPVTIDFDREDSIGAAADALAPLAPFQLIVNAAGVLHSGHVMPEKKLADLHYEQMLQTFRVNTFGPALLIRHLAPLLDERHAVLALLSARVGSIEDNRLGGWYSYRASKAALNMIVKTSAIELKRRQPAAVVVALHPGTVDTRLSGPFGGARTGRPAHTAAAQMLDVLDRLGPDDSGRFISYSGQPLPW